MKLRLQKPSRATLVIAVLYIGLVAYVFCAFFDPTILNPTNIGWIAEGDLRQHYLGWVAFRQADTLGAPLASSPLLAYPFGAPIAATDSNPLVSLILWPIQAYLPDDFQFIGPWYLLSIGLSLLVATALMRKAGFTRVPSLLLGAVLAFQPILFWRYGHDTLMAQWLLLAVIYVSFAVRGLARALCCHAALLFLAISIHPYLFVIANFVVGFDLLFRVLRRRGLKFGLIEQTAIAFVAAQVAAIFFGAKLGVFSLKTTFDNEIGLHTTDLLSFFNPFDASRVLPQLPATEGQYEGFAYLGLGTIILAVAFIILAVRGQLQLQHVRRLLPVIVAATAAFLFALVPTITLLGDPVFAFEPGDGNPLRIVLKKLRSSGRFVWLTVYVLVFSMLLCLPRKRPFLVSLTAIALLSVQVWDLKPLRERTLSDTAWREVPPHELATDAWGPRIDRAEFVFLSRKLGLDFSLHAGAVAFPRDTPLTWFYTAQGLGLPKQQAAEEQLRVSVLNGGHEQTALFLLDPTADLPLVHRNARDILATQSFEEFHAIETKAYLGAPALSRKTHGLPELLELCEENCTAVIAAKGNAFAKLSAQTKAYMGMRSSQISLRQDGDGYVAILRDGVLLGEKYGQGEDVTMNATVQGRAYSALSSVEDPQRTAALTLDGADLSRNEDGLNLLLVMDDGRLVTANFDTSRKSDSLYPDDLFAEDLVALTYTVPDPFYSMAAYDLEQPASSSEPFIGLDRVLSKESSLLDVISSCRQDCMMAISVKDEGAASLPRPVRESAAQIGLTMAELNYRDGYSAIIENGIVLVQGRSSDEIVDVAEVIADRKVRVRSAGFEAGAISSIEIDGKELSMARRGFNIVVLLEGERTISYHFDTHGSM